MTERRNHERTEVTPEAERLAYQPPKISSEPIFSAVNAGCNMQDEICPGTPMNSQ